MLPAKQKPDAGTWARRHTLCARKGRSAGTWARRPGAGHPFVFVLLLLILAWPAPAQARQSDPTALAEPAAGVKIMPLGDSITSGTTAWASYRYWLYKDLVARHWTVNFVGSIHGQLHTGDAPPACCQDFDWDHEGHSGYRVDNIIPLLPSWLALNRPDIVLLHLGTNDILQGRSVDSTAAGLGQVIDLLRAANPRVKILLAQIIPAKWNGKVYTDIPVLNALLPDLVAIKTQKDSPVLLIDQYTGFDLAADCVDGVHPNPAGEQKLALHWRIGIEMVLRQNLSALTPRAYLPLISSGK